MINNIRIKQQYLQLKSPKDKCNQILQNLLAMRQLKHATKLKQQ